MEHALLPPAKELNLTEAAMKRLIGMVTMLIACIVLMANVATAGFLNMDTGVTYTWKYQNWELLLDGQGVAKPLDAQIATGDQIWGLLRLSTIHAPDTTTVWAEGAQEVTGYFSGLTVSAVTPVIGGYDVAFTGGSLDMYYDSTPDAGAPTPYIGGVQANGYLGNNYAQIVAANPGYFDSDEGNPFLTVDFGYGVVPGDFSTTQLATVTALSDPYTGVGSFYADAVGGYLQHLFDSNALTMFDGTERDFFSLSNISTPNPVPGGTAPNTFDFHFASNDPAIVTTVPEPSTFLLIGAGLCSCFFFRRKRKDI